MSTTAFTTAITQARDLLRWRSPLRTELWAARLTATLRPTEVRPLIRQLTEAGSPEAHLTLAALAVVDTAALDDDEALYDDSLAEPPTEDTWAHTNTDPQTGLPTTQEPGSKSLQEVLRDAGKEALRALPEWAGRMGQVVCEQAWYGKADRYGEQALAALRFRYPDGKEPHVLIVGIDQVNGGLAVDAVVEEPKFLDDLDLRPADPAVVAGRVLDAFEMTDLVLGAPIAESLPAVRPLALARARTVPDPVRQAPDDTVSRFLDLPDLPGAQEAFGKLVEFVGDRPLWWSPARVSRFLTSWLPREAILTEAAISAMPDVVRAWSRFHGGDPEVLQRIEADAPRLPALMADDSLAGLRKRMAQHDH
ncbi:hypothetical protein [Nonomuraea guangzhouensis]|uniref:Uncharacterized protein n=1 Tax=Nonomuraea guangzhouensis TaxID=1291555 RepID=A0ABW4G386_9ACTN|nr:hypothetical protein [Nonomuraea guangzhouensis]